MLSKLGNIKILSCGSCRQLERLVCQTGRWRWKRFPARCYVIPLQEGFMLFDSGYSARARQIMNKWPAWIYKLLIPIEMSSSQTAVTQLKKWGVQADDIKYIFISHFHADHIGGLRDFPKAKFICSQKAYQGLKKLSPFRQICKGFVSDFLPDDFEKRVLFVGEHETEKIHELTVHPLPNIPELYAVELPGHAQGQLGLWLKQEKVLLAADAGWQQGNLKERQRPSSLALAFCDDKSQYIQTLTKLAAWSDVKIVFTHEEQ